MLNPFGDLFVVIVVAFGILLGINLLIWWMIRGLVLWYFRINEIVDLLAQIERKTRYSLDEFGKPFYMNSLQTRLAATLSRQGEIYFSDIRDALEELHDQGVIADLPTAKVELSRLIDKEEIRQIDDGDLHDLSRILLDSSVHTVEDVLANMDKLIDADDAEPEQLKS